MRKSIILVIALGICAVLSSEGWAARIQLGRHSVNEIKRTCGAVGGDFFSNSSYGCTTDCAPGTGEGCAVECTSNGCTGSCPRCGSPRAPSTRRPGGANEVTRTLRNLARPAKRY